MGFVATFTEVEGRTDITDSYPDLKYVRQYEATHDVNKG